MKNLQEFWKLYDKYIETGDKKIRPRLSCLLAEIENSELEKQLLRSEKGWNKIFCWQFLRDQQIILPTISYLSNNNGINLKAGELIFWQKDWDRDVLLCHTHRTQFVPGYILHPGYLFDDADYQIKQNESELEFQMRISGALIADLRGLYLPVYEIDHAENLYKWFMKELQEEGLEFINEEAEVFI